MKESTHSLWAWLNQPEERHKYLNPLYSHNPLVIWPSVEPQSIQLWQGEWDPPKMHPQLPAGLAQGQLPCPPLCDRAELTPSPFPARFFPSLDPSLPAPGGGLGGDPEVGAGKQLLPPGEHGEKAEPAPP